MKTYELPKSKLLVLCDSSDDPERRTQHVSALYGQSSDGKKYVTPEIWLRGDWLKEAGFDLGDTIGIEIHKNELRIIKLTLPETKEL